jgi:hypothetical protein
MSAHEELLAAAEKVLAGLNTRIDRNVRSKLPVPVFEGIAELHSAVALAQAERDAAAAGMRPCDDAEFGMMP